MNIRHCLDCGKELRRLDDTHYECPDGHPYYNNPRAGASVIFLKDGQILAAKRGIEPGKGKYSLVGGFLEFGEDPHDAAQREAREETGVDVTGLRLIDVFTTAYQANESTLNIMFLATGWKGDFVPADDVAGLEWQPIDAIDGDRFFWHYPGLTAKLKVLDNQE